MADVSIMRAIQDYSGLFWSRTSGSVLYPRSWPSRYRGAASSKADSSERARDSITDMTDDGAQEARTPRGGISGYWNLFREGCAFAPFVCEGRCPLAAEFERLHTPCSALAATTSL